MSSEIDKIINGTIASFKASNIHLSEYEIVLLMDDISEDKYKELVLEYAKRGD